MVSRLKGLYFRWSWFPNCTWYMYLAKFQQNPWGSGGKFLKFRWFHMEWPYKKQVNNFVFSFLRSPLKLVSSNFYILPTERISNFDSPFSKLCSFKRVVSIGSFWLFMKIKERSKTSFRCTFPAYFFHKNVLCLFNTLPTNQVSVSDLLSFSRYQTKWLFLNSCLAIWWHSRL